VADDDLPSGVVVLDRPRPGAGGRRPAGGTPPGSGGSGGGGDGPPESPSAGTGLVALHPRMERRRLDVQRDRERRRLHRAVWVLAVVALLVVGAALSQTPAVDVDHLLVAGEGNTSEAAVRWASGIRRGDALLTLDERGAERRIEELPWVAHADVVREWPGTVRVVVRERQPEAAVQAGDRLPPALVDHTGRVLDVGGPVPPGLVVVTGLDPGELAEGEIVPAGVRDALRVAVGARERVPGAVASISLGLDANLTAGGRVRFGSPAALDEKLVALATFLTDVDLTNLDVLDLRVPGSAAITRRR
jgi:cell division protein FtsQ